MDENSKMNEIRDNMLENISGGTKRPTSITCPNCNGKMKGTIPISGDSSRIPKYICPDCHYALW